MSRLSSLTLLAVALALVASACSNPRCPKRYVQRGDTCKVCPEGSAPKDNECVLVDGGQVVEPVDGDGGENADDEDERDSAASDGGTHDARTPNNDADTASGNDADTTSRTDAGALPGEYALGVAGASCNIDQMLACDGHASRKTLKCQQGSWQVLQTCAQNERCDSRVGTEQGTCAAIPAPCVGKTFGAICDGLVRLECGIDLVNVNPSGCPTHAHCDAASGQARCGCDAGYEDDGAGGCTNPNDCPTDACAGGSCVDGLSDYSCDCDNGFAGTGTKACTPVLYCPKDACTPGGTCVDVVNWSCTCNTGFTGSGTRACTNIDDCPSDRCKAPNGICKDLIGSYECSCNPGFSGPDCTNDICANNPCRNGGTCSRTGTLCSCAQGFSGVNCQIDACNPNPCQHNGVCSRTATGTGASCSCAGTGYTGNGCETDVNECLAGTNSACGAGATACTNTNGGYRCTCGAGYAVNRDERGCHLRAWGTPVAIDNGASGGSQFPVAAIDDSGNVTAVWYQAEGSVSDIRFNRFSSGAWQAAAGTIDNSAESAAVPAVAVNKSGVAVAAWNQYDGTQNSVWASRSANGGAWSTPVPVESSPGNTSEIRIGIDSAGNAFAAWIQQGTNGVTSIWVSRGLPDGTTWENPTLLENDDVGSASAPSLSVDRAGRATVVWSQSNGSASSVVLARYAWGAWGFPVWLTSGVNASEPRVVASQNGNAIIAWRQIVGTRGTVFASKLDGNTDGVMLGGNAIDPETTGGGANGISIAFDPAGNGVVAWSAHDGNQTNLWANRYSANGNWAGAVKVDRSDADTSNASAALDGSGNVFVAWAAGTSISSIDIWAARVDASAGSAWGTPTLLETTGPNRAIAPSLVADAAGNVTAVWMQWDGQRNRIYANRYE